MKKTIKKSAMILLSIIAMSSIIACDNDSDEVPGDPEESKMVNIGFGLSLTPQNGVSSKETDKVSTKSSELHTYVKTGYTVTISGGVAASDEVHYDVNLEETLTVEVVGDIDVTVYHPDFNDNALDVVAYFGIKNFTILNNENSDYEIPLELVQGFVLVTAEDGLASVVTSVKVLGLPAELDVVYYTNATIVDVIVQTKGNTTLTANHTNVLGQGVQYMISTSPEGIEFTFPVFGTPGDGVWFP